MKHWSWILPFLLYTTTVLSQPISSRVMSMGNVTLAVPDLQNEVWNNPAKMISVHSLSLHLTPTYGSYSNTVEQYFMSSNSSTESYTNERTFLQGTTDIIVPLQFIAVGGTASLSKEKNSETRAYQYTYINPTDASVQIYQTTTAQEYTLQIQRLQVQAAVNLVGISFGGGCIVERTPNSFSTNSTYTGSSFWESETTITTSIFGLLAGSCIPLGNENELSVSLFRGTTSLENKLTSYISHGIPYNIDPNCRTTIDASTTFIDGMFRFHGTQNILVGIGLRFHTSTSDEYYRQQWNSPGIYEERKNSDETLKNIMVGSGISYTNDFFLISGELWYGKLTTDKQYYALVSTSQSSVREPISMEQTTVNHLTIRAGSEFVLHNAFTLRAGAELFREVSKGNTIDKLSSYQRGSSGNCNVSIHPTCGVSIRLTPVTIEYALAVHRFSYSYYRTYIAIRSFIPIRPLLASAIQIDDVFLYHQLTIGVVL